MVYPKIYVSSLLMTPLYAISHLQFDFLLETELHALRGQPRAGSVMKTLTGPSHATWGDAYKNYEQTLHIYKTFVFYNKEVCDKKKLIVIK